MTEAIPHKDPNLYTPTPKTELSLSSGEAYFDQLADDISRSVAGDRVALSTMSFEPSEPPVAKLMEELGKAADRGVDVLMAIDAFTFLLDDGSGTVGPMWLPLPIGQSAYRRRLNALEELGEKPSVRYGIINKPTNLLSNPFSGRSHIKACVLNDRVSLLGPNLHKTNRTDLVVSFEDTDIANWLFDTTSQIIDAGRTADVLGDEDLRLTLDDQTQLLIDSGKPGQSLILDEAIRMIAAEDQVVTGSFQYFPTGRVADELVQAHQRGARVTPIHNHPSNLPLILGIQQSAAMRRQRRRMPAEFFMAGLPRTSPVMHSKGLATSSAAMAGNHNIEHRGVKYGTPELMLYSTDPGFANTLRRFLLDQAFGQKPVIEILPVPEPRQRSLEALS